MRCVICDFCEELPLSGLGLAHGYLPGGGFNRIDHSSGLCLLCLYEVNNTYLRNEEQAILEGEVPLMDSEWDGP